MNRELFLLTQGVQITEDVHYRIIIFMRFDCRLWQESHNGLGGQLAIKAEGGKLHKPNFMWQVSSCFSFFTFHKIFVRAEPPPPWGGDAHSTQKQDSEQSLCGM